MTEKAYISIHLLVVMYIWSHVYLCFIYGYALGYVPALVGIHVCVCCVVFARICVPVNAWRSWISIPGVLYSSLPYTLTKVLSLNLELFSLTQQLDNDPHQAFNLLAGDWTYVFILTQTSLFNYHFAI